MCASEHILTPPIPAKKSFFLPERSDDIYSRPKWVFGIDIVIVILSLHLCRTVRYALRGKRHKWDKVWSRQTSCVYYTTKKEWRARTIIPPRPSITQAHSVRGSVSEKVWWNQTSCVYYTSLPPFCTVFFVAKACSYRRHISSDSVRKYGEFIENKQ